MYTIYVTVYNNDALFISTVWKRHVGVSCKQRHIGTHHLLHCTVEASHPDYRQLLVAFEMIICLVSIIINHIQSCFFL